MTDYFNNFNFFDEQRAGSWVDDRRLITSGGEELFTVKFYPTVGEAPILRSRLIRP